MRGRLKACAHCGGKAIFQPHGRTVYVSCSKCHACSDYEDTQEAAAELWNRRTPAPMTNVVTWVRYDGTEETLPEENEPVRLSRGELEIMCLFENCWVDTTDSFAGHPKIGDLWCYLPTPPEADA